MAITTGLPWPCWGTRGHQASRHAQSLRHIEAGRGGRPQLPRQLRADREGSGQRQVGEERSGRRQPAGGRKLSRGQRDQGRPPARVHGHAHEDGLGQGPHARGAGRHPEDRRRQARERRCGPIDMSGGIQRVAIKHGVRAVRQRQGALRGVELPGRRAAAPRAALHQPTRPAAQVSRRTAIASSTGCRCCSRSIQKRDVAKEYPVILTSGRLVGVRGWRRGARSNPWLAELQQDMFVEINPADANNLGIKDGQQVWVGGSREGQGQGDGAW